MQNSGGKSGSLGHPFSQQGLDRVGERGGSLLASLAFAADVRAGAEGDVAAAQPGELGYPKAGLDGQQDQHPIPSPLPPGLVRGRDQRIDLEWSQERDDPFAEPFRRDRPDTLDERGGRGVTQRAFENRDRIAVIRTLRVRMLLRRSLSR